VLRRIAGARRVGSLSPDSFHAALMRVTAALGQLRTHAPQQSASSFDHLVDADEQRRRNVEVPRVDGLEIDYQLVPGPPKLAGRSAFPNDDAIDVACLVPALVNYPKRPLTTSSVVSTPHGTRSARQSVTGPRACL